MNGNTLAVLTLVIGLVLGVVATIGVIIPLLQRKGINIGKDIELANDFVDKANQIFDMIKPFLPNVPAIDILDKVLEYTQIGVNKAEQLYHIGQIPADQRKPEAKQFILDLLNMAHIEVTPELDKVIDGAIEASVMALGHTKFVNTGAQTTATTIQVPTPTTQTN